MADEAGRNMPEQFQLSIQTSAGSPRSVGLTIGGVLYVLGANGSGKSSLVSRLFNQSRGHAKRISAHRQTWFESNTLDIT
jgi:ABC-type cobalamin/Fe3+-siderophores transport system ATPase subunit